MYLLTEQQAESAGFKLLELTACGGTAAVYKAQHKATEKYVALKVLNSGGNALRIKREARVLSTMQHRNIATFVAVGEIGSTAYVATQWIEGTSLRQWLNPVAASNKTLLDVNLALVINKSLVEALTYAHCNGITHGDINLNNILITNDREVVIIDFGLGRASCDQTITATTELAGTPRYLAPELISGELPSPFSDQYALALVLYELLTGHWPFPDLRPTAATALHHQLYTRAIPIREFRPDLSASMDLVFRKALEKLPCQRFENVQHFHEALVEATSSESIGYGKRRFITAKHAMGISLALMLSVILITSVWWTREEGSTLLLASMSPLHDSDWQQVATAKIDTEYNNSNCNLYVNSTFDNGLEDNFYQDARITDLAIRVDHPHAMTSPVLQVGANEQYGNYGIILKITAGQQYSYSASLMFSDYVHKAELNILWLDESWQTIDGEEDKLTIQRRFDGTFHLRNVVAPDMAHYAVPTIYKDASAGILYADNVIFAINDKACYSSSASTR